MSTLALTGPTVGTFTQRDPLEQAFLGFLARYSNENTRHAYAHAIKLYFAWCEREQFNPLDAHRAQLEMYLRYVEQQGLSESTMSRRFGAVCGMYKWAAIDDLIRKDPAAGIKRPTIDHAKQRCTFLPPADFGQLIKYVNKHGEPREAALIALIGLRGLRISEACGLNIENIADRQGYRILRYVGKGGKYHEHVLPVPAMEPLKAYIGDRTEGPVLLNQWGRRMNRKQASAIVKDLARRAGVNDDISPHSLRRSMITAALVMGENLYDVQRMVGHANAATTARYDRLAGDLNRDKSHAVASFLTALAG